MDKIVRGFLGLVFSLASAAPVVAGVADSPLPVLEAGATTYHLYTVPGGIASLGLGTYFACTSLEPAASIQVGVELFGPSGGAPENDAAASSLSLPPGATRIFGTSGAVGISVDSSLGGVGSKISARILATSKKVACTAFIADFSNAPPTSMTYLTIIAKLKQKAAN